MFFSTYKYGIIKPVFIDIKYDHPETEEVLAFAGIAKPQPFFNYLDQKYKVTSVSFPDHHFFTPEDLAEIKHKFSLLSSKKKIIITTEKDATRLRNLQIGPDLKSVLFFIPIEVNILFKEQLAFETTILNNVRANKKKCKNPKGGISGPIK